jgi:hypothetical protein
MVAENDAAGTLHVHRQDARLARNELAEKAGDQAHLAVDAAARRLAGDERHRLAAIEVLRLRGAETGRGEGDGEDRREHMMHGCTT